MVTVAQLVESRIVIPVVVGSSPISHPSKIKACSDAGLFLFVPYGTLAASGCKMSIPAPSVDYIYITAAPDHIARQTPPILDFDLVKRKINKYRWQYISI
jgi:hypothetical protein